MTAEPETPEPEEVPAGAEPELGTSISVRAERGARMTPSEAVRDMRITLPARGNRTLRDLIERVNRDTELKALWHAANVNAVTRLQINDHSWVHIQIVTNIGLKLLRELRRAGRRAGHGGRLRHDEGGLRGGGRPRLPDALPRHGDPPHRPRGHEPLPRGRPHAAAPGGPLRGAGADDRAGRGAPDDHLPPLRRRAALGRGRRRARGGRARHGQGPLADPVRVGPRLDPLALGRRDRGGTDQGRRRDASRSRSR